MKKHLKSFAILLFILVFICNDNVSAAPKQKRLAGQDRFKTSSAVVEDGWKQSDYVILVNGENFPDSLSAAVLAKKYNSPLVLTKNNILEGNSKTQIKRLGVKNIYIVGGDFVIKPNVEKEIKELGITTERIYGKDRYATSVAVAEKIGVSNGIILATGKDYTDALSIAPIAAKLQVPILLVPKDSVPSSIANFIKGKTIPKTYVVGGIDIISDKVANAFPNVQRITGKDKYERNINIIKEFEDKLDFRNVILAYSEGFPDALSGAAYAAINGNPIALIGYYPNQYTNQFLKNKNNEINELTILGGNAGIKDYQVTDIINGNSNLQLENIISNSVYNFELKDKNGDNYTIYIYSDDLIKGKASYYGNQGFPVWAGARDGDIVCSGHFKVAYFKNGSNHIKIKDLNNFRSDDNMYTFNLNSNLVRTVQNKFKGYQDFLQVGQTLCSNDSSISLYCIKDGILQLVNVYNDNEIFKGFITSNGYEAFFKQIGENTFITSVYYNGQNFGYDINTYKFNNNTCSFTFVNKKHVSREEYKKYYYSDLKQQNLASDASIDELRSKIGEGKIEGLEFNLGDERSSIISRWGNPDNTEFISGGECLDYDLTKVFYIINPYNESVSAMLFGLKDNTSIFGTRVGMTQSEIEKILGKPSYEGVPSPEDEFAPPSSKWGFQYNVGRYNLIFYSDSKDGSTIMAMYY